jgi:predicted short-subunit dehydrogenase-like oxidoreductase (DUF2520 family)
MPLPNVTIIGTGNLALHLSKALERGGMKVAEVAGRQSAKAQSIASQLYDAQAQQGFDFSSSEARLFFLCVSDAAISAVASQLVLPEKSLVVHCSGATSVDVLSHIQGEFGVFYPVQTFSAKRKVSFKEVPVCLEASSDTSEELLETVAKKMESAPCFMNSSQRLTVHLSAVFACNFTNHFFLIAQTLLQDQGLPWELLHPLIEETVTKALEIGPKQAQTGPAIRKDYTTMGVHEELLEEYPEWQELYRSISKKITKVKE